MAQKTIDYKSPIAFPGQLADGERGGQNIIRGTLQECFNGSNAHLIPFGAVVVYDPAEPRKVYDLADSNKPAGATTFKGIAVISHRAASTFDALIKGNHGFSPGDPVDTLTQGDIWVKTESPVTVGNTAYYRTTAVTDKPLGGFTDTQAAEVTEIAGSQWIKVESDLAVLNLGGF